MVCGRSASGALILPSLPGRSRRARTADCLATSLGPSSTRNGTPRISQSLNFQPGLEPSRSSSVTRTLALVSSALTLRAVSRTVVFSSSFLKMGTMTA